MKSKRKVICYWMYGKILELFNGTKAVKAKQVLVRGDESCSLVEMRDVVACGLLFWKYCHTEI